MPKLGNGPSGGEEYTRAPVEARCSQRVGTTGDVLAVDRGNDKNESRARHANTSNSAPLITWLRSEWPNQFPAQNLRVLVVGSRDALNEKLIVCVSKTTNSSFLFALRYPICIMYLRNYSNNV